MKTVAKSLSTIALEMPNDLVCVCVFFFSSLSVMLGFLPQDPVQY